MFCSISMCSVCIINKAGSFVVSCCCIHRVWILQINSTILFLRFCARKSAWYIFEKLTVCFLFVAPTGKKNRVCIDLSLEKGVFTPRCELVDVTKGEQFTHVLAVQNAASSRCRPRSARPRARYRLPLSLFSTYNPLYTCTATWSV